MTLFDFAVAVARRQFQDDQDRLPVTHWQSADYPQSGSGYIDAVCGERVRTAHLSGAPTCPLCRAWIEDDAKQLARLMDPNDEGNPL